MQYKDIEIFLELVRTRNITKAAEQMYISQSTVSNRLKSLEAELGYQLVVRSKGHRTVQFTYRGDEFIPIAERWKNLYEETELLKKKSLFTMRIATNESTYYEILNPFLIAFMRKHPSIKQSIKICDSEQIYRLAETNLIDYGFASYESSRNNVLSECINTQNYCIIRYSETPVSGMKIHPRELDPAQEFCFTGGHFSSYTAWHEKWFGVQQYACHIELNSCRAAVPYLKEFGYWAMCPKSSAEFLLQDISLQIYQLEDPPEGIKIYLLKRNDSCINNINAGQLFEGELKEYLSRRA